MNELYFSGTIDRIIFENPANFYKILLLEIDETNADFEDYEVIVTGTIADVIEGEEYRFYGQLVTHPKYGQQLQVTLYLSAGKCKNLYTETSDSGKYSLCPVCGGTDHCRRGY